uniref:Uncharacterized protein n=1 Tax=Oryza nivara TaxID=4536 RepID=A0A0E0HDD9_ORYNI
MPARLATVVVSGELRAGVSSGHHGSARRQEEVDAAAAAVLGVDKAGLTMLLGNLIDIPAIEARSQAKGMFPPGQTRSRSASRTCCSRRRTPLCPWLPCSCIASFLPGSQDDPPFRGLHVGDIQVHPLVEKLFLLPVGNPF